MTAGLTDAYKLGDPLNERMTGFCPDQPDLPFWAVSVLQWVSMVTSMQRAHGKLGVTYRGLVKQALEEGLQYGYNSERTGRVTIYSGPAAIYGVYQSFCATVDRENSK